MIKGMARKLATIDSLPALFDEGRRPIYAIDAERRIVYCNPALAAWLDIAGGRVIGRVVEYHSEPHENDNSGGDAAPLTDLCPPPRALAGEACMGTLSRMGRAGRLVHRKAEFVPLASSRRVRANRNQNQAASEQFAVLVLLAEADMSTQEVAAELSGEPAADELHRTIRRFQRSQSKRYSIESLLGSSAAMQKVRAQVMAAATSGANTLVIGPRGSGRGHVARAIHYRSMADSASRLVAVDCEEMTDDLLRRALESMRARPEEAKNRPTLLLENLDEMAVAHQLVLIAAISREGVGPRVIATCSRHTSGDVTEADNAEEVDEAANHEAGVPTPKASEGTLSGRSGTAVPATLSALIDAVSTITIRIPRLAERVEDLPVLAQYFLETGNRGNDKQVGGLRSDALDLLALYSWPGELVQLRETIVAAHRTSKSHEITPADLPSIVHRAFTAAARARRGPERIVLDELLATIEKEAIVRALAQTSGNKSEAAALLGMTRPRLYRRLVQLGLAGEIADESQDEQPEFIEREPSE
jgi:DNA-binding NtrC family response regulator